MSHGKACIQTETALVFNDQCQEKEHKQDEIDMGLGGFVLGLGGFMLGY